MRTFLIGCAVLLLVGGCAGTSSEAPKEGQGHTEATKEQTRSPQATESEQAQCEGTRTIKRKYGQDIVTNDVSGCPKGGLLRGTNGSDNLRGYDGDDKIRALGAPDNIFAGNGNDVIYAGPGHDRVRPGGSGDKDDGDDVIYGGSGDDDVAAEQGGGHGADVIYAGDGNDLIVQLGGKEPDKLYCGKGKDTAVADKNDYVDSSCEKKANNIEPPP